MKLKALSPSLWLALLVTITGCSTPQPAYESPASAQRGDTPIPYVAPSEVKPDNISRPAPSTAAATDKASVSTAPMPPVVEEVVYATPAPPPASRMLASSSLVARRTIGDVSHMPAVMPMQPLASDVNIERYTHRDSNPVQRASEQPVSTFSIDVDTGSYTHVRRMLNEGRLPPADAVRAEEFINYFDYGYTPPVDREKPFSVTTELAPAPWNATRQLLLVGIQGYRVPKAQIPAANLVFLIDTSGSMDEPDKLPLLKASLKQLVRELRAEDRLAIVTYAGNAGVALPTTAGDRHATIDAAVDNLGAGGATNGGAGIDLAYAQAGEGFIKGGVNRVILATDGDFNVGNVNEQALKTVIEDHRKSGIALTTLGFGEGNYNDAMAVMLADAGNGSHHYIDSLAEGRRVLVDEMSATLLTIANDVKIQVEFNPAQVQEYRLIGYEKRLLKREDFNNDKVDAGDIGAGANVTAIYEITIKGSAGARIDALRYGDAATSATRGNELAFLRLRYKLPGHSASRLIEQPIDNKTTLEPSERLRYVAAVTAFANALRGGKYLDGYSYERIATLARGARGSDADGYRAGFVQLVKLAGGLATHDASDAMAAAR